MEELTLRDFLEMAREFGVKELTAGPFHARFDTPAAAVEYAPPLPPSAPVMDPMDGPVTPNHPALWGPKGPPSFRKAG